MHDPIGDDPVLQACALAYLSDDLPTDAVVAHHPERPAPDQQVEDDGFMSARLDHAIWFHRPPVADQWHVPDFATHGYLSSPGPALRTVPTQTGTPMHPNRSDAR